jgi:hypothetical protein
MYPAYKTFSRLKEGIKTCENKMLRTNELEGDTATLEWRKLSEVCISQYKSLLKVT